MSPVTRRSLLLPLLASATLVVGACGAAGAAAPTWTYGPVASQPAAAQPSAGQPAAGQAADAAAPAAAQAGQVVTAAASSVKSALNLTIVTGGMIGKTEYPAYVPSDFSLPANSTVVVTITNFDDATPLPAGSEGYAKATGIVDGTFSVTPIDLTDPNASKGAATTATSLDPTLVSHTFTIPELGINVPIAAHARVTFTIKTGAPGTYAWRCFDPCGADPAGWGTAMAAKGYMEGTLTVTA